MGRSALSARLEYPRDDAGTPARDDPGLPGGEGWMAMTFRKDADLSGGSVSGGRGGGRRGMAVGGGVGGIVVVLVALFLGLDPGQLGLDTGGGQGDPQSQSRIDQRLDECTGEMANTDTICRIKATTISLEDVWGQQLPQQTGMAWEQPHTTIFEGSVSTACGAASSDVGPFYCPADQDVYMDPSFFDQVLAGQLGGSDDLVATSYVVAHEFGHHLQNMLGDLRRSQQDPQGPSSGAVRAELQADCYAGIWFHYATSTPARGSQEPLVESLTEQHIDAIIQTAEAIGDDHIQKTSGSRVDPSSWTHGSSQMRRQWLVTGYEQGTVEACDTFRAQL